MAVIYGDSSGGGLLGTLSGLASLGGTFIPGMQWLTPLGMGLGAIDAAQQGNTVGMANAIQKIKEGGWKKPTDGNIASTNADLDNYDYLEERWGPAFYGSYGGKFNQWQR